MSPSISLTNVIVADSRFECTPRDSIAVPELVAILGNNSRRLTESRRLGFGGAKRMRGGSDGKHQA